MLKKIEKLKRIEFRKIKKSLEKIQNKSRFCKICSMCINDCKQEKKSAEVIYCPLFKKRED